MEALWEVGWGGRWGGVRGRKEKKALESGDSDRGHELFRAVCGECGELYGGLLVAGDV